MSGKVLVTYGSWCGSTAEVGEAVGKVLREAGCEVDVRPAQEVQDLAPYQSVVLGGAVRAGRLHGQTVRFAKRFRDALQTRPTAYYCVCLTMSQDTPENRLTAEGFLKPLRAIREPQSMGLFGGNLDHSKLSGVVAAIMRAAKAGDHRNCDAIRAWAQGLGSALA